MKWFVELCKSTKNYFEEERKMKTRVLAVIVCVMATVNFASADTIRGIGIDFVTIGNAGNAGDTVVMTTDGTTGYGTVGYNYRIGKYEVTNTQWNAFTAAAGTPTGNDGGYSNSAYFTGVQQPTNNVSWYEAAQFCNYLTTGDKSKGAYQFSGNNANPSNFLGINRDAAISSYGIVYVIPTEDEWYKAAYFKPNGSGYSPLANGTGNDPINGVNSNYNSDQPWNVGTGTMEQNGTYDMMGNVWERNETLMDGVRGVRGGSYTGTDALWTLRATCRGNYYGSPNYEFDNVGFRVAQVPEPATLLLLGMGGLALLRKRRAE
jgi:sulfatase modifying factor 1